MAYTNIDDPSAYFQTVLYTGTSGNARLVTNDGNSNLKPDLVWIKGRSNQSHNLLYDSTRGVYKQIYSDLTNSEATVTNSLQEFSTDGFKVGSYVYANENTHTFVAWQWKANGGTTSSNTAGNITSTVQVNSTAGFSIVTWTGNENSSATVGHGLGVKPDMVFFKRRNATYNWVVYCGQLGIVGGNNMFSYLNLTNAAEQGAGFNFTSTTITPTNGAPTNSGNMVAYCFAEKQGYSKFGTYYGNGSTNGAFIYTGFKPAFVLFKNSSNAGENWIMYDHKRDPYNESFRELFPNSDIAEYTANAFDIDILSNGFKHRGANTGSNGSAREYIYMAFAENPFVTSTGVPACAR
jgi:hypothetical protein